MLINTIVNLALLEAVLLFGVVRVVLIILASVLRVRTTLLHELGVAALWLSLAFFCRQGAGLPGMMAGGYSFGLYGGLSLFSAGGDRRRLLLGLFVDAAVFVPFGFLPPALWRRFTGPRVVCFSLALSVTAEVLGLFTGRGAGVVAVVLRWTGAVAGYGGYRILASRHPGLVLRFRLFRRPRRQARPQQGTIRRRTHRRGTAFVVTAAALCTVCVAVLVFGGSTRLFAAGGNSAAERQQPDQDTAAVKLEGLVVDSTNGLLVSADGSRVLWEKQPDQRIYPASMTKVMTALLALEALDHLEEPILLGQDMFAGIYGSNASTAGFLPGEAVPVIDLIYGAVLPSGAECAVGLAEAVAGSEAAFAALMNDKAAQLGMTGTHFVNATGLHHRDHYSTAGDIAKLMGYALENPTFREIVTSRRHSSGPTNLHPDGITYHSTLFSRMDEARWSDGQVLGGKTGYTDEAGQCLASVALIGGEEYILVTAGARPEDFRTQSLHIDDALAVYGMAGRYVADRPGA